MPETALLFAAFVLPFTMMLRKSPTFDEVAHVPAGYSYLRTGRIVLNPMHPPLIKEICALPLLLLDLRMPAEAEAIARAGERPTYQWQFGKAFLTSQDAGRILFWARLPALLLSVGAAAIVMKWAGELWGRTGGIVAGFLYVFDPTIAAHAPLVTTDVGLGFFALLFLFELRRYVLAPSATRVAIAGVTLGLALGSKFTAIVLVPVAILLVFLASPGAAARDRSAPPTIVALALMISIASVTLWAIYLFPRDPLFYWHGLRALKADANPAYETVFMGGIITHGSPTYLLIEWLVKTPVPSLVLVSAAVVAFVRGQRARAIDEAFLALPVVALFVPPAFFAAPLGVRYLIPCLPFAFVFTARLAPVMATAKRKAVAVVVALVWYVTEFVAIAPDHLAYFNEAAGGPRGGLWWLSDSNVDWGQGLIELRDYLAAHPKPTYRLCYFGSFDPRYYGIGQERISVDELVSGPPRGAVVLSAYCVSLAKAKLAAPYGDGRANWLADAEPNAVIGHAYYLYDIDARGR